MFSLTEPLLNSDGHQNIYRSDAILGEVPVIFWEFERQGPKLDNSQMDPFLHLDYSAQWRTYDQWLVASLLHGF